MSGIFLLYLSLLSSNLQWVAYNLFPVSMSSSFLSSEKGKRESASVKSDTRNIEKKRKTRGERRTIRKKERGDEKQVVKRAYRCKKKREGHLLLTAAAAAAAASSSANT